MKVFVVVYQKKAEDGDVVAVESVHATRLGAVKAVAWRKADILKNWDVTDITNIKEGFAIGFNCDGIFEIHDMYSVDAEEVYIEEMDLED